MMYLKEYQKGKWKMKDKLIEYFLFCVFILILSAVLWSFILVLSLPILFIWNHGLFFLPDINIITAIIITLIILYIWDKIEVKNKK